MIIPWQELEADTLYNLIKEFILREGTDYGAVEQTLEHKIEQVKQQLVTGEAVIMYSELHESVDIQLKRQF